MKNKLLGIVMVVAVIMAAGWNFIQSKNDMKVSDFTLSNVDALAQTHGEYDGDLTRNYALSSKEIYLKDPRTGQYYPYPTTVSCCVPVNSQYSACAVAFLGGC